MALSDNDRVSSNGLSRFASQLWTKIKSTFALKTELPSSDQIDSWDGAVETADEAKTSADSANEKISNLNLTEVGGNGKYIQSISEYEGKVSATAVAMPTSLPASDVSAWAKASTKPTYTASEVGAATKSDITSAINGLDVAEVGESGKYVQKIKEVNGMISATLAELPKELPANGGTATFSKFNKFVDAPNGCSSSFIDVSSNLKSCGTVIAKDPDNGNSKVKLSLEYVDSMPLSWGIVYRLLWVNGGTLKLMNGSPSKTIYVKIRNTTRTLKAGVGSSLNFNFSAGETTDLTVTGNSFIINGTTPVSNPIMKSDSTEVTSQWYFDVTSSVGSEDNTIYIVP